MPILTTNFTSHQLSGIVPRPRLIERLDEGLHRRLTLISASAGFGKTTLLSEWVAGCGRPAAWLSLDEGDKDTARFLAHLVAALRTVAASVGEGVLGALESPQPPPTEALLTAMLNEIATIEEDFVLVLDDYHVIDARPVDDALAFLLEHLPPRMHLAIATREDPRLPLARLRARDQLTELRAADLRFTPSEAAEFLNRVMCLDLSVEESGGCSSSWASRSVGCWRSWRGSVDGVVSGVLAGALACAVIGVAMWLMLRGSSRAARRRRRAR